MIRKVGTLDIRKLTCVIVGYVKRSVAKWVGFLVDINYLSIYTIE